MTLTMIYIGIPATHIPTQSIPIIVCDHFSFIIDSAVPVLVLDTHLAHF